MKLVHNDKLHVVYNWYHVAIFAARRYTSHGLCRCAVSVRLSVTFIYCIDIFQTFHRPVEPPF